MSDLHGISDYSLSPTTYCGSDERDMDKSDDLHCKHGTYIGGPSGIDYICGQCEDGELADESDELPWPWWPEPFESF